MSKTTLSSASWIRFVAALFIGSLFFSETTLLQGQQRDFFGKSTEGEAALIGILYDLKQKQDHQPTDVSPDSYKGVVDEFLSKNWDESVLNRYYRVSKPLYTTQIFVPMMNADEAPKAFGVANRVQPSRWIIHYKGQVSPPEAGVYRFWGRSDDLLAVAVNSKTVLVGTYSDSNFPLPKTNWHPSDPDGARGADVFLRPGDWIDLKQNQVVDLDVIIGERPGGFFNAFLLIEKKGVNYAKDSDGHPILPIFQVAAYDTPVVGDVNMEPKFAKGFPIWKSYQ